MKWIIGIAIGVLWILAVLCYLALFKGAARGDRLLDENKYEDSENNKIN